MTKNKKKKLPTLEDKLKYEIAEELGLTNKIKKVGWGGLTAKETGKVGGHMTAKQREMRKQNKK